MTTTQSKPPSAADHAEIGVIGGSGFYSFLDVAHEVSVDTPFGPPSDPVTIGRVGDRRVAFLPRHGRDHRFLPHRVNYRANLWALRSLGVRQVIAPCAVGSLRTDLGPGSLVIPDQVIERTWGRETSVFDVEGPVVHVGFADPYCPRGRATLLRAAEATGWTAVSPATLVVINGPRFSSRAESRWHAAAGADIVNMTGMPEAAVARELALCYTAPAWPTGRASSRARCSPSSPATSTGSGTCCCVPWSISPGTTTAPAATAWTGSPCRSPCPEDRRPRTRRPVPPRLTDSSPGPDRPRRPRR